MKASLLILSCTALFLTGCGARDADTKEARKTVQTEAPASFFKPDPATVGILTGSIAFTGRRPPRKLIDMSEDPACVEAHHGKPYEETVVVNSKGALANAFVYIKSGLDGKKFEPPTDPATIDQRGCWFNPRVIGIQTGQPLRVINSDPVTHNIHPLAQVNREWNHSQGPEDPPLARKFIRPEIMIPVKCNIHSWMHAYIGVVDNPYFAVSAADGSFAFQNVPPGDYVVEAWHETLGAQQQSITMPSSGKAVLHFVFTGK